MLIAGFPSPIWGTNCWVVASGDGEQCIVIDPGVQVVSWLDEFVAERRLHPVGVLLTHGHLDHTFSVVPVCQARDVPAYVHPADRGQLVDPWTSLGLRPGTPFPGLPSLTFAEPEDVRPLTDGAQLPIAGLDLRVHHASGHTPGSVVFTLPATDTAEIMFSGDLLFAGSIGRVDLPGGSMSEMTHSLKSVVLPLDDATVVHPGHGPSTTVGRERRTNPYLMSVE